MPSVADLLVASHAAHARYRQIHDAGQSLALQHEAMTDAYTARKEAFDRDPERTDPAWDAERHLTHGDTHLALMAFYTQQLGV